MRNFVLTESNAKLLILGNIALAPLTTLKVGGAARFFVEAKTDIEIIKAVSWAKGKNFPLLILGGGSNLLVSDNGFDGLVLRILTKGIDVFHSPDNSVEINVRAGEDWDDFVRYCAARKYQGIECLSGIPGTVGASPVQNIGAYGQEVSRSIKNVKCYDREKEKVTLLSPSDCKFTYRRSIFNTTEKNRYVILAVRFRFFSRDISDSSYKDLKAYFGERKPTLIEMREAVLRIRRAKSMLIDENDPNSKSAGSFFKNPIVSKTHYLEIVKKAGIAGIETVPGFAVDDENVKIPAAWLIEQSGFYKGYKLGNAGLSTRHTLAIVNLGNATAADILKLKDEIQAKVKENFNIELLPEPVFVET